VRNDEYRNYRTTTRSIILVSSRASPISDGSQSAAQARRLLEKQEKFPRRKLSDWVAFFAVVSTWVC